MTLRSPFKLISLMFILFYVVGCGAVRQVVITPDQESEKAYYEALNTFVLADKQFTSALVRYNNWCEQPGYAEACKVVDPYWVSVNDTIMAWGTIIELRKADNAAYDDYLSAIKALKSKILMEFPSYDW